ncbi:MAG: hypothetical protein ABJC04_09445, partial [Verrucomicrobiota bacterium]
RTNEVWIELTSLKDIPQGAHELSVKNENGESGKVKIYLDDLPQYFEDKPDQISTLPKLPATFWGTLDPLRDTDEVEFHARAGETLVFEFAAKRIGSKASGVLTLFDDKGNLLAENGGFEGGDPLLAHQFSAGGNYRLKIADEALGGAPDYFYRVSIGAFPEAIGFFPMAVQTNAHASVKLIGYNIPEKSSVKFKAEKPGEVTLPVDARKYRPRKAFKVLVTDSTEAIESEPNDTPAQATRIKVPGGTSGRIFSGLNGDVDYFQFEAKAGEPLIVETLAARRGSPADTKIEILHADGKPVERLKLQAVRDSQITFRGIDSNAIDVRVENWEEMELNQLLYLRGEVAKIFRMPQGPDSGFQLYGGGKRIAYFNTSAISHANEEPCYIVEPHSPDEKLVANGLPVFPIYFANDDDGERKAGADSRVQFLAPTNGIYLVRVSDSRGLSGEQFVYRLSIRPAAPDFSVTLNGATPTVPLGCGQEFSFSAERTDGFEGDITMEISAMPEGFVVSNPITIQAGHFMASGTIFAAPDAKNPVAEKLPVKITATAMVNGKKIVKEVSGFTKIMVGEKPKLRVAIEPYVESQTNFVARSIAEKPLEITIVPGEIVPAWLKIQRDGHDDLVTFTIENLPHGVIVDNIGLNGVLIPKGENERQIFLKAAKWVPETDRFAYCKAQQAGNPTSLPLLIHVRKLSSEKEINTLK